MIHQVGIIANQQKKAAADASTYIESELRNKGLSVWTEENMPDAGSLELIIVCGGDGTVLRAFKRFCHLQIPFLCINFGSLGFLSAMDFNEFTAYLPSIITGSYQVDERPIMEILISKNNQEVEHYYALNDLVIRSGHMHISRQLLRIDNQSICLYEGDGLIIATSTGSTGYAMSAGASVVEPGLDVFIINALFPRKKHLNSFIIGMNHKLQIICHDADGLSKPYIDGLEMPPLKKGDTIFVHSTDLKARFVVFNPDRYFRSLWKIG